MSIEAAASFFRAGGDLDGRVLVADPVDRRGADVADQDLGAGLGQVPDQAAADLADALDGDAAAAQVWGAPDVLGGGQHALVDAVGGEYGGVAGAAVGRGPAGDVGALAGDDVHVLAVGAHVAGGDVAPVQRLDEPAVGAEQGLGLQLGGVPDDDRLAAAVVQAGQGVLVGHGPGQAEHVLQGRGLVLVGVEPGSAQGGAELGGEDRDDRAQPGGGVLAEHHLFVTTLATSEDIRHIHHSSNTSDPQPSPLTAEHGPGYARAPAGEAGPVDLGAGRAIRLRLVCA